MQQNVGIRVAVAPSVGRDAHTAQHKRAAFNQPVCVVADANPEHDQSEVKGQKSVFQKSVEGGPLSVVTGLVLNNTIFHSSFLIYHLSFKSDLGVKMTNEKFQMRNGKSAPSFRPSPNDY